MAPAELEWGQRMVSGRGGLSLAEDYDETERDDRVADDEKLPSREVLIALNRSATTAKLLAGAVHEVNNALQVISGTVEILQGRTDLGDPVTRALERVRNQSARAAGALSDVTVFTKGAVNESVKVDLRETVAYCLGVRRFAINRAGLSTRFEPDPSGNYEVMGTRSLIQQAILNLIMNAEQALTETRGTIEVEIRADGPWVDVRVVDEGPGVGVEPRERVFDPFVSTRDPWQGAGLGLWAARAIVEAHGGTLITEDRPSGAVFVLRLPKAE
jgi:signal transduction histidine kinase